MHIRNILSRQAPTRANSTLPDTEILALLQTSIWRSANYPDNYTLEGVGCSVYAEDYVVITNVEPGIVRRAKELITEKFSVPASSISAWSSDQTGKYNIQVDNKDGAIQKLIDAGISIATERHSEPDVTRYRSTPLAQNIYS